MKYSYRIAIIFIYLTNIANVITRKIELFKLFLPTKLYINLFLKEQLDPEWGQP